MRILQIGKDYIMLEEVKSSLYSRELSHKASENNDEGSSSGLTVSNSEKWQNKKKFKVIKKGKVNPKDICNYCKECGHWKKDCLKKRKKIQLLPL